MDTRTQFFNELVDLLIAIKRRRGEKISRRSAREEIGRYQGMAFLPFEDGGETVFGTYRIADARAGLARKTIGRAG